MEIDLLYKCKYKTFNITFFLRPFSSVDILGVIRLLSTEILVVLVIGLGDFANFHLGIYTI